MKKKKTVDHLVRYLLLLFFALIWVVPIYIAVVTPFKSTKEIFTQVLALPAQWNFGSFVKVWKEVDILRYMLNSFLVTGITCLLLSILPGLAAYGITRSQNRVIKGSYLLFSVGIMIPTQACMIALFNVLKSLHLYNTLLGMVCAYLGCCIPVSVFLFYGFFKSIPGEIIESAYMDGCTEWGIYVKIIMPLSTSAVGTVVIYNCVNIWKDFTYPLIFTQGEKLKTLPIAIYALKGQYVSDYSTMFAGVLISTLPLLVVYLALQKQFIAGITAGAVKG